MHVLMAFRALCGHRWRKSFRVTMRGIIQGRSGEKAGQLVLRRLDVNHPHDVQETLPLTVC